MSLCNRKRDPDGIECFLDAGHKGAHMAPDGLFWETDHADDVNALITHAGTAALKIRDMVAGNGICGAEKTSALMVALELESAIEDVKESR